MTTSNLGRLAASLAACQAAGLVGSVLTGPAIREWYAYVDKPWFNPPNWLFGPVWTLLYLLMGVALYRVWLKIPSRPEARGVMRFFLFHLALNAAWSGLFFGLRSPMAGLVGIIALWITLVMLIRRVAVIDRFSARLLWPYLAWVSFASVLNFAIWRLN